MSRLKTIKKRGFLIKSLEPNKRGYYFYYILDPENNFYRLACEDEIYSLLKKELKMLDEGEGIVVEFETAVVQRGKWRWAKNVKSIGYIKKERRKPIKIICPQCSKKLKVRKFFSREERLVGGKNFICHRCGQIFWFSVNGKITYYDREEDLKWNCG